MTKQVNLELNYIPKGERGSLQNKLRRLYNSQRRHDLTKTQRSKEDTLRECIQKVKCEDPAFIPDYRKDFFHMGARGVLRKIFSQDYSVQFFQRNV